LRTSPRATRSCPTTWSRCARNYRPTPVPGAVGAGRGGSLPMTRRMEKVADLLQTEIAELLLREVKHPALTDVMISITRVEVSPDLGSARVHVSIMDTPEGARPG